EAQRRTALAAAEGAVGRAVTGWLDRLSAIAAQVEAQLDFADEADVEDAGGYDPAPAIAALLAEWRATLAAPSVERLRDGITVVIAGPPNAGKSSLFNALADRDAAIVTPIAGTTRDVLEAAVMRDGIPYRLTDTAGLAEATDDEVERIGIDRAATAIAGADVLLWMGAPAEAPAGAVILSGKADLPDADPTGADLAVSARLPHTIGALWSLLADRARSMLTIDGDMALRQTQRDRLAEAAAALDLALRTEDLLIVAEQLRVATRPLAALLGKDATEAMLDALFGRFCLGK
ncbi:GTPase, partial [uncultured Sphingomonas sp.]|uniref:GTPase n=1 Tax=uncultured Sphingomonas sp. TaxID=158754 RepID=UPI00258D4468